MGEVAKTNSGLKTLDVNMTKAIIAGADLLGLKYTEKSIPVISLFINDNYASTPRQVYDAFVDYAKKGKQDGLYSLSAVVIAIVLKPMSEKLILEKIENKAELSALEASEYIVSLLSLSATEAIVESQIKYYMDKHNLSPSLIIEIVKSWINNEEKEVTFLKRDFLLFTSIINGYILKNKKRIFKT